MKPLSSHWADIAAMKVAKNRKDKDEYVLASGITPSGRVHVGNFREVITANLVGLALQDLGKNIRFIYSWDNFDTFRKVPKNLPDTVDFTPNLYKAIARIPDPWEEKSSYAEGRIAHFEEELKQVGIEPEYIYQEAAYKKGQYAASIKHVLENLPEIKAILNQHRKEPLADDWLPTSFYCTACGKDRLKGQKYLGDWMYSYHCAQCDHQEEVDIRKTENLKLIWRLDWPMRWAYENVDFEPGGKDHSSKGGSYDTGKELVKTLWDRDAPEYLQYDFVAIKGGAGKMSSSSGELFTLAQVLSVYEPEVVRWIFAAQRPNHDFSIAFDEDVFKVYEEFDKSERSAFDDTKQDNKWLQNRRAYRFAQLEPLEGMIQPQRASFRILCNRLQICSMSVERTYGKFYKQDMPSQRDHERFLSRAARAVTWIEKYAPKEFCYKLHTTKFEMETDAVEDQVLVSMHNLVSKTDLDAISNQELNELLWSEVVKANECDPKKAFRVIYQKLIGRDQGPRLPAFLKEIGKTQLLELF